MDSAGGIYQYDNYDEVAMDTDSETNSPGKTNFQLSCIVNGLKKKVKVGNELLF